MKPLRIFFKLCELNLKKLLMYRVSFFISLILTAAWVVAYTILIEVIFYHTDSLAGWSKGQVLLIMAFYYVVQNIADVFFKDNFEEFGETIRRGDLDFRVVKPAPLRLLSFFWQIRFDHTAGVAITGALFYYALKNLNFSVSAGYLGIGFLFAGISVVLYFSILSFIGSLTFWVEKNETFNALIFNISQLSRYPRQIYRQILGKILTFGIPVALIATIPAEVALQIENGWLPLFFIFITIVFYILGKIAWHYGLKRYTSAN